MANMGGVERIFTEKMNYLADICKYDVFLITLYQGAHPLYYKLSSKVKHIDMGIRIHTIYTQPLYKRLILKHKYRKLIPKRFQQIITEINPDIIAAVAGKPTSFILDVQTNSKIVMESHQAKCYTGVNYPWFYPSQMIKSIREYLVMKKVEKKSDAIVTLTHGDAKEWNAKDVVVIPNIVDLHNNTYSPLSNKVALFAGRFVYQKGLERMLESWKIVVDKRNDWVLKLVGEGEQKKALIEQCKMLGIENYVIFEETTNNMTEEYYNTSIFLLTSKFEGFALVLAEAIQCGVPCISFDCPYGPAEIIDNGENGILVENENIEEFANAILKLIDDEDLRKKMGKAAIEKSKDYLPERIMPQWIDLFNKLTTDNIQ